MFSWCNAEQTMQTQIRRRRTRRLIRVCTVYLNYRKFRAKWGPRLGSFSQPTLRDNRPTRAVSTLILLFRGTAHRHVHSVYSVLDLQLSLFSNNGCVQMHRWLILFQNSEVKLIGAGILYIASKWSARQNTKRNGKRRFGPESKQYRLWCDSS